MVAVPSPQLVKKTPPGNAPLSVIVGWTTRNPLVVTLNVLGTPAMKIALFALVMVGAWPKAVKPVANSNTNKVGMGRSAHVNDFDTNFWVAMRPGRGASFVSTRFQGVKENFTQLSQINITISIGHIRAEYDSRSNQILRNSRSDAWSVGVEISEDVDGVEAKGFSMFGWISGDGTVAECYKWNWLNS
jgi:hypothetical protein